MQVTSYQMHNVMDCYSKKLSRAHQSEKPSGGPSRKTAEQLVVAPEAARKATMEKIGRQVLDKIADVVALGLGHKSISGRSLAERIDSKFSEKSATMQWHTKQILGSEKKVSDIGFSSQGLGGNQSDTARHHRVHRGQPARWPGYWQNVNPGS